MRGSQNGVFKGLKIDHHTLHVQERKLNLENPNDPWSPRRHYPGSLVGLTTPSSSDGPRKCMPIHLDFCQSLPYNSTSYPNAVGHKNAKEMEKEVIAFRQIIDFECYVLAQEFVCNVLQPKCMNDKTVPPCRSFCKDFKKACKNLLPKETSEKLNCSSLPDSFRKETCVSKPGCADELRFRGKTHLLCDGVLDCPDFSDESDCEFCKPGQFHCGIKQCIDSEKRCNLKKDCENGSDESGCLTLESSNKGSGVAERVQYYVNEGFVTWRDQNNTRRICLENLNGSLSLPRKDIMLRHLATATCTQLHYRVAEIVEMRTDPKENSLYSKMSEPLSTPMTFTPAQCSRNDAVYLKCSGLECGVRPSSIHLLNLMRSENQVMQRVEHGDWPWHVVLYMNGKHECDATLIGERWVLAPSKCFDKGQYTNWTTDLGRIRLSSSSPYEQQRAVQRVLKSPEYKSPIALLKLESPANVSDYIRPVCLPKLQRALSPGNTCYTFAWDNKHSSLQQVVVRLRELEECQNHSIYNNVLCAASTSPLTAQYCREESVFPMPLLCQVDKKWMLAGIASESGIQCNNLHTPHLYHRIDHQVSWLSHIMAGDT